MTRTLLTLTALVASSHAFADAQIVMTDGSDDSSGEMVISVSDGKMAFSDEGRTEMIFDKNSGDFTILNHEQKGFVVMDDSSMKEVRGEMNAMMKEMQAQLDSLPPAQREQAMKMMPPNMAAMMGGAEPEKPKTAVSFTGKTDKVGGYKCRVAKIDDADGMTEACVAKPDTLGVSGDDYETMASAFDAMASMASQLGQTTPMPNSRDLGGIPIRTMDSDGSVMSIKDVSNDKLDGAIFEVPAGYSRQSIMDAN